jgi:hypothetical protein
MTRAALPPVGLALQPLSAPVARRMARPHSPLFLRSARDRHPRQNRSWGPRLKPSEFPSLPLLPLKINDEQQPVDIAYRPRKASPFLQSWQRTIRLKRPAHRRRLGDPLPPRWVNFCTGSAFRPRLVHLDHRNRRPWRRGAIGRLSTVNSNRGQSFWCAFEPGVRWSTFVHAARFEHIMITSIIRLTDCLTVCWPRRAITGSSA